MVKPCGPSAAEEKRWRAEDDLRALNRAEEIRKDAKRMAEVKRLATEQIKSLSQHLVKDKDDTKKRSKKPMANALMK